LVGFEAVHAIEAQHRRGLGFVFGVFGVEGFCQGEELAGGFFRDWVFPVRIEPGEELAGRPGGRRVAWSVMVRWESRGKKAAPQFSSMVWQVASSWSVEGRRG